MPTCTLRFEADSRYAPVRDQLQHAIDEVVPFIAPVTKLSLPGDPVVRLVSADIWEREVFAYLESLVHQDTERYPEFGPVLQENLKRHRANASWATQVANTCVDPATGQPQVLVIAETAYHSGADDDELLRTMAHELTHLAQQQESGHAVFDIAHSYLEHVDPDERIFQVHMTMEGHACWADAEITRAIRGQSIGWPSRDNMDDIYREAHRKAAPKGVDNISELRQKRLREYDEAAEFVRSAIEKCGIETVNSVWKRLTLFPTDLSPDAVEPFVDRLVAFQRGCV